MMNKPSLEPPKAVDSSFSTFTLGLTIGIVGALLLGTEEGRKTARKILRAVSEGIEENEDIFIEVKNIAKDVLGKAGPVKSQDYFPDQPPETSPPPPPLISHSQGPTYFQQEGHPLKS